MTANTIDISECKNSHLSEFDVQTANQKELHANRLPLLITPEYFFNSKNTISNSLSSQLPWQVYQRDIKSFVEKNLFNTGGILFRGFTLGRGEDATCKKFAKIFNDELLSYNFGSTPRTNLGEGVYTATEYPAHQIIPLHNEQAYTLQWPLNIWFHCVRAPLTGGETPIADSRRIYQKIPKEIRKRFEHMGLLYVRNYGNGLDLPWSQVFNTEEKQEVERYCRQNKIEYSWKDDGELRTRQLCHATAQHPITGEWVWFNQAHLFHVSNLDESTREILLSVVEIEDLPRNVYYGDGSTIEDSILDEVRGVLAEESVYFPWQEGDLLMLDNMLVAHGRSTFTGDRKIVVAMANGYNSLNT